MTIKELVKICHEWAIRKGFWDKECAICGANYTSSYSGSCPCCTSYPEAPIERNDGEMIALMHSELSEALEELRKPSLDKDKLGEELADCVIRIMDYCGGKDIDLEEAILKKMKINERRPYKHGKNF